MVVGRPSVVRQSEDRYRPLSDCNGELDLRFADKPYGLCPHLPQSRYTCCRYHVPQRIAGMNLLLGQIEICIAAPRRMIIVNPQKNFMYLPR